MSFVPKMLGIGGGGSNFKAQSANLLNPVSVNQANNLYGQTQEGLSQQQAFLHALQGQNQNVFGQQQNLADQLALQAQGLGPNPALAQLNQTTGQNIAAQNALMAGQRGSGANAGLLARQAAMQGSGIEQQALGQGAVLSAQQQLAAQQALGQQTSNMIGQQAGGLQNYNQYALQGQQNLLNAIGQQNQANLGNVTQQNQANASIAAQTAKSQGGLFGGVLGGLGAALIPGGNILSAATAGLGLGKAYGGEISPAGQILAKLNPMMSGGNVDHSKPIPGKAEASGDSLKNDKVPAMLSPGEVVIPRSVMKSQNPVSNAAKFVEAVMAKKRK